MKKIVWPLMALLATSTYAFELSNIQLALPVADQSEGDLPIIYNDHHSSSGHFLLPEPDQGHSTDTFELFVDQTVKQWVVKGINLTSRIYARAYHATSSSNWKKIFRRGYNKTEKVIVHWPGPRRDFVNCGTRTLAFTYVNGNRIYLCRVVIDSDRYQLKDLAQILVHEVAHDIGYADECDATKIEVSAMRLTIGLQFKNGYWDRCGIE